MDAQKTYSPIGRNADGDWVNYTNTCKRCGYWLPLPEYKGKSCPKCGTYVGGPSPLPSVSQTRRVCKQCKRDAEAEANFCIKCGTKL